MRNQRLNKELGVKLFLFLIIVDELDKLELQNDEVFHFQFNQAWVYNFPPTYTDIYIIVYKQNNFYNSFTITEKKEKCTPNSAHPIIFRHNIYTKQYFYIYENIPEVAFELSYYVVWLSTVQ